MSGEKFTKGEWVVYLDDDSEQIVIGADSYNKDPSEYFSCHKMMVDCDVDDEEAVANAHLIAAAPDMYEKLKEILEYIEESIGESDGTRSIETLLAKARGESNEKN